MSKLSTRRPKVGWERVLFGPLHRSAIIRSPFEEKSLSLANRIRKVKEKRWKCRAEENKGAAAEIKVSARVAPFPELSCVLSRACQEGWMDVVVLLEFLFCTYRSTLLGQPKAGNILATCSLVWLHSPCSFDFYVVYSFRVACFSRFHKKRFRLLGCISIGCISVNRPLRWGQFSSEKSLLILLNIYMYTYVKHVLVLS